MTANPVLATVPPGAVGMVTRDAAVNRDALLTPFRAAPGTPEVLVVGPLGLAWTPAPSRDLHVADQTVCFLEGDIYNIEDMRRAAGTDGPPARVLATAYLRLGEDALRLLRGDFWTLIWDGREERGLVAADQLGSRSPHWTISDGNALFASDVPELIAALPRRPGPDPIAMAHWVTISEVPEGRSLFEGVRRLEAACLVEVGRGAPARNQQRRYWAPRYQRPANAPRQELVARIRDGLDLAVRRRLAEAPGTSILLSGGLDSSAIAAMAMRVRASGPTGAAQADGVHAYSVTFPDLPQIDEAEWIDHTVSSLGIPSTRALVRGGSALRGALAYLNLWQVPPTSPNLFFWTPLLRHAAADGFRVMLDGEGGDEMFGFSAYLLSDRLRHGRVLSAADLAIRVPGSSGRRLSTRTLRTLRGAGIKGALPYAYHAAARRMRSPYHYAPAWLRPEVAGDWNATNRSWAWKAIDGPRWWAWQVYIVTRGLGPALVYEQSRRRAAIGGIVPRHPMVDVDLIETVLKIPPEIVFDARHSRPLLREALAGMLPDEVRLRTAKSSFDAIFHAALAGSDLPAVRRILGAPDAEVGAYVDMEIFRRDFVDPEPPNEAKPRQTWAIHVWRMLMAECWLRMQADGSYADRLAEHGDLAPVEYDVELAKPVSPMGAAGATG